jgi:hypothetical protein
MSVMISCSDHSGARVWISRMIAACSWNPSHAGPKIAACSSKPEPACPKVALSLTPTCHHRVGTNGVGKRANVVSKRGARTSGKDNDSCNQLCVASNMYICTLVIPTRPHTRTHLRSAEGSLVCPLFRSRDLVHANLVFGGRTAFS